MSANTTKALFRDALYQVLDNKAFRVLVGLVVFMILPTFLIGAREDSLVVLFGWKEYFYEDFFNNFDLPYVGISNDNRIVLIQALQKVIVDGIAGSFGIIFAVAATAFFLPNMIEKGSADTVFSKPVSRLALMLSRYVAGLIFVALLACLLVFGIHFGFLLNSGYSDPGFLWSALTLIYLFAILHAFSILVGVFTRSTVAAILLSLMFFAFNGCVHGLWKAKEFGVEKQNELRTGAKQSPGSPVPPIPTVPPVPPEQASDDGETLDRLKNTAFLVLDILHYTLPKTADADLIAQKLRRTVENRDAAFYDDANGIKILVAPEGFTREQLPADPSPRVVRWTLAGSNGVELASATLSKQKYESGDLNKTVKARKPELAARGIADVEESKKDKIGGGTTTWLSWTEKEGERSVTRRVGFFVGGQHLWELELAGDTEWMDDPEHTKLLRRFSASITFRDDERDHNPFASFEQRASWTGPLAYNLTFSIFSSIAFTIAILALAWWKLSRIDF